MIDAPHVRLQLARTAAAFQSATEAAKHFGFNENTYRSHENGERGLKPNIAKRYAEAFKISASWLLTGEGNARGAHHVPLIGHIGTKGLVVHIPEQNNTADVLMSTVKLPFVPPKDCVAFLVTAVQTSKYEPQDLILSWGRSAYSSQALIEGVIWTSERDAVLQLISRSADGRRQAHHRLAPSGIPKGALFDPVHAVLTFDTYEFLDNEIVKRWYYRQR